MVTLADSWAMVSTENFLAHKVPGWCKPIQWSVSQCAYEISLRKGKTLQSLVTWANGNNWDIKRTHGTCYKSLTKVSFLKPPALEQELLSKSVKNSDAWLIGPPRSLESLKRHILCFLSKTSLWQCWSPSCLSKTEPPPPRPVWEVIQNCVLTES